MPDTNPIRPVSTHAAPRLLCLYVCVTVVTYKMCHVLATKLREEGRRDALGTGDVRHA